jgi:hypothetical protein
MRIRSHCDKALAIGAVALLFTAFSELKADPPACDNLCRMRTRHRESAPIVQPRANASLFWRFCEQNAEEEVVVPAGQFGLPLDRPLGRGLLFQ